MDDFFIGGAFGQPGQIFVQNTAGTFSNVSTVALNLDFLHEDMESIFIDIDNDNDNDLFVVSGGYEFNQGNSSYKDRLYINDGFGNFNKAIDSLLLSSAYLENALVNWIMIMMG